MSTILVIDDEPVVRRLACQTLRQAGYTCLEADSALAALEQLQSDPQQLDGTVVDIRSGIGISNGLAFSPDGRTMYFADTSRRTVWAYDFDPDDGRPSNERVFVDFSTLPGRPDGACVDADGGYWIACVYGWAVARVTPDGRVDRLIEVPVEKPSMPAFGGRDMTTVFVTSTPRRMSRGRWMPAACSRSTPVSAGCPSTSLRDARDGRSPPPRLVRATGAAVVGYGRGSRMHRARTWER